VSEEAIKKFKVGCNHLSAVKPDNTNRHRADKLSELDYVKNIGRKCFSSYINLEVTNSIKDQLRFRKYLAKILAKTWNKKS
jgi:hypothetical protein